MRSDVYTHAESMGKIPRRELEKSRDYTHAQDLAHDAMNHFRENCVIKHRAKSIVDDDDSATKRFKLIEFDGAKGRRSKKKR